MNSAAVAGTSFGTGNSVPLPADDPAAAPIQLGDQFLIILERSHIYVVSGRIL